MSWTKKFVISALAAVTSIGVAVGAAAAPPPSAPGADVAPACPPAQNPGVAHCGALQLLDPAQNWHGAHADGRGGSKKPGGGGGSTGPSGYFPSDLQSAYNLGAAISALSTATNPRPLVAVVDAYNDPNAASDLATYRSQFGLPACTARSGCFTQVSQSGSTTNLPADNTSWSEEISLDLDMVSAICPACRIALVEASSASIADLGAAVDEAVSLGAVAVSNSYGSSEFSGETADDVYYDHPGVAITASAGDGGYGVEYPAASPYVTAVGGTSLVPDSSVSRGWSETVWSGTGSGCSADEPAPSWQPSTSLCTSRTVADVAAVADPNTGVAVYDSYGESGWLVFGGTSVASPIVASIYALAGNTSSFTTSGGASTAAEALYHASLYRVTSGSNARHCSVYLCNAADSLSTGYNGPTGNGTPDGITGF
ncbi:MAG: S53 family peptidase [Acidimicrobiales bacterium]